MKILLIPQSYHGKGSTEIATKAHTAQRIMQRFAMCIATSHGHMKVFTPDVMQALVQARSHRERKVYIRPPPEMSLPQPTVLQVGEPLYGIPSSGLHWYLTYLQYHLDHLGMERSGVDACFLMRRRDVKLDWLIVLQVDDSLGAGTTTLLAEEESQSHKFKSKSRCDTTQLLTTQSYDRLDARS